MSFLDVCFAFLGNLAHRHHFDLVNAYSAGTMMHAHPQCHVFFIFLSSFRFTSGGFFNTHLQKADPIYPIPHC